MKKIKVSTFLLLSITTIAYANLPEYLTSLSVSYNYLYSEKNPDSRIFSQYNQSRQNSSHQYLVEIESAYQFLQTDLALYHQNPNHNTDNVIVKELFVHKQLGDFDVVLGKRRVDYGVSYGFRPLDLFMPYEQNPIGVQIEEGASFFSLSQFSGTSEISLFAADSKTFQQQSVIDITPKQRGVGARYYRLQDNDEWQAIIYWDNKRKLNAAISYVTTLTDTLEFHSEMSYQQRYMQWSKPDLTIAYAPVTVQDRKDAILLTTGFNWSNASGHNVIVEYWLDTRAFTKGQWRDILAENRPYNPYSQRLFQTVNINQNNILVHWQRKPADSVIYPTIDYTFSPDEWSQNVISKLNYDFNQSLSFEVLMSYYFGAKHTAYRNLPNRLLVGFNIGYQF